MKRWNFCKIYERTKLMLMHPETGWETVRQEKINGMELFKSYLIPLALVSSIATFLLQLFTVSVWYALAIGIINFVAAIVGTYITYRIVREYLLNKINEAGHVALHLAIYSTAIFIVFHCLSEGLGVGFFSQVLAVVSLMCLRTVYVGLNQLTALDARYKKSSIVIVGALVIVSPVIIVRLLTIICRIPTIYA